MPPPLRGPPSSSTTTSTGAALVSSGCETSISTSEDERPCRDSDSGGGGDSDRGLDGPATGVLGLIVATDKVLTGDIERDRPDGRDERECLDDDERLEIVGDESMV